MATLEKIRSHSGLLIASVAIALLCFVVGDALNNSSTLFNGNSRTLVGEAGGKSISVDEFQKQVSVMTNVYKASGQARVDEGVIRDQVWGSFVQNSIVESQAEEVGLSVTAAELKDATLGENVHPMMRQIPIFYNENRQFDKNILYNVLAKLDEEGNEDLKNYWLFWEKQITNQILLEKYQNLAAKAMSAPKAELDFVDQLSGKQVKVAYACKQYRELADSLFTPTKEAINKKYEEKKALYKTDELRKMQCIVFDVNASNDDYEQTAEKVKSAEESLKTIKEDELPYFVSQESDPEYPYVSSYLAEKDIDYAFRVFAFTAKKDSVAPTMLDGASFKTAKVLSNVVTRPDSVKVKMLGFRGITASATVDSLMKVLKSGESFDALLTKYPNGAMDLGWVREGQVGLDTIDNVIFTSKAGEISKIENDGVVFLTKVEEVRNMVKKVRLAVISNKVVPSGETYRNIFEKANSFIAKNNTKEKFVAAAEAENLQLRELGPMTENQSNLYVVENARPIVKWAFDAKVNDVCAKPFDSKDRYVIGYLSEVVEKGFVPASSSMISSQLEYEVVKDMKAEKLMADYSTVSDLNALSAVVDTVTVSLASSVIPGRGAEPALVSAAVKAAAGQVVAPIKGNEGIYAIKVVETADVPANAEVSRSRSNDNIRNYVGRAIFQSLIQNAEVNDNRSRFY